LTHDVCSARLMDWSPRLGCWLFCRSLQAIHN